jgi:hypothetical protein
MKTKSLLLILSLFIFHVSCEKQNSNSEVESYITLLRTDQYDAYNLPEFQPSDIPALLKYINDTNSISRFPRNGISSYMQTSCKLGMIVLWTIESIRAIEINSDRLVGRFPSQNPILALRGNLSRWVFDSRSQLEAAKAYDDWWHSVHIFTDKMKIDPLKDTPYSWH